MPPPSPMLQPTLLLSSQPGHAIAQGVGLKIKDFKLVVDKRVYSNLEGRWQDLLNRIKWDVGKSVGKSALGIQKSKLKVGRALHCCVAHASRLLCSCSPLQCPQAQGCWLLPLLQLLWYSMLRDLQDCCMHARSQPLSLSV